VLTNDLYILVFANQHFIAWRKWKAGASSEKLKLLLLVIAVRESDQLPQDAAKGPCINRVRIFFHAEYKLRRTVESRDDMVGKGAFLF
jgi:hypothetical protein